MHFLRTLALIGSAFTLCLSAPAFAGWKLLPAGALVPIDQMTVRPSSDWNRASARPGKQGWAWTKDGFGLNGMELFGGVPSGEPLYRERSKKHEPMPKFDSNMLAPELADFFERSFRVQNKITDFVVSEITVAEFGGHQGIALSYRYSLPNDELRRRGIARMAVVRKKFFVANFYAPELHYFPSTLPEVVALMDSARF